MNEFHECVSNGYGDWRINGKQYFLPVKVILDYVKSSDKTATQVCLNDIAWKGLNTKDTNELSERYHECDISFPGVVVEGGENPYFKKYRMIDGCHRIKKIIRETNRTHSDFFVLSNEEFLALLEKYESQRWQDNEHIELKDTKDYFGFPACTYRFKKHQELKEKLIESVKGDLYVNGTYVRRKAEAKPLLWDTEDEALIELKKAYYKAYEHFYNEILFCDLSLNHEEKNYQSNHKSKPIITQSWVVGVPPNPTNNYAGKPMSMHSHFLSPVCGAYYLNLDRKSVEDGGNLIFQNPMYNDVRTDGGMMYLIEHAIRASGLIERVVVHPLTEGEIVLWTGVLHHTIEPLYNTPTERISIITNSCVTPLSDGMKKYNYNIDPFYEE